MGSIFDGIQRPLKDINELTNSIYIPKVTTTHFRKDIHLWKFLITIKTFNLSRVSARCPRGAYFSFQEKYTPLGIFDSNKNIPHQQGVNEVYISHFWKNINL